MGRKINRGRQPRITTERQRPRLWTEEQLDEFLEKAGIDLLPWQRDTLVRFGARRSVGVALSPQHYDHPGRSAGKNTVHRLTKEVALALGHEVRDTVNGFEITLAIKDEVRL